VTARPGQQICADRGMGLCTDSAPQPFEDLLETVRQEICKLSSG